MSLPIKIRYRNTKGIKIQVENRSPWKKYIESENLHNEIEHTNHDREIDEYRKKDLRKRTKRNNRIRLAKNLLRRIDQTLSIYYNNQLSRKGITRIWTYRIR